MKPLLPLEKALHCVELRPRRALRTVRPPTARTARTAPHKPLALLPLESLALGLGSAVELAPRARCESRGDARVFGAGDFGAAKAPLKLQVPRRTAQAATSGPTVRSGNGAMIMGQS